MTEKLKEDLKKIKEEKEAQITPEQEVVILRDDGIFRQALLVQLIKLNIKLETIIKQNVKKE